VKKFLTKASLVLGFTLTALAVNLHAQTVAMNGLGSSAIFLELGLAASSATTATPAGLGATCLWTENTSSVVATDTSTGTSLTDTGNAWVAGRWDLCRGVRSRHDHLLLPADRFGGRQPLPLQ